jgi:hypothetical protein
MYGGVILIRSFGDSSVLGTGFFELEKFVCY